MHVCFKGYKKELGGINELLQFLSRSSSWTPFLDKQRLQSSRWGRNRFFRRVWVISYCPLLSAVQNCSCLCRCSGPRRVFRAKLLHEGLQLWRKIPPYPWIHTARKITRVLWSPFLFSLVMWYSILLLITFFFSKAFAVFSSNVCRLIKLQKQRNKLVYRQHTHTHTLSTDSTILQHTTVSFGIHGANMVLLELRCFFLTFRLRQRVFCTWIAVLFLTWVIAGYARTAQTAVGLRLLSWLARCCCKFKERQSVTCLMEWSLSVQGRVAWRHVETGR